MLGRVTELDDAVKAPIPGTVESIRYMRNRNPGTGTSPVSGLNWTLSSLPATLLAIWTSGRTNTLTVPGYKVSRAPHEREHPAWNAKLVSTLKSTNSKEFFQLRTLMILQSSSGGSTRTRFSRLWIHEGAQNTISRCLQSSG